MSLELMVSKQTAINVVLKKKVAPISLKTSTFLNSDVLSTNMTFKIASDYVVLVPGITVLSGPKLPPVYCTTSTQPHASTPVGVTSSVVTIP